MSWNNKVELIGSLGADPELRFTNGGRAVMNFRMATTEKFTDQNKVQREETDWHSCVCWGDKATEYQLHLRKGSYVRVEGKLKTSTYDDKDGNKRYKTEVIVNHVAPAAFPRTHDTSPAPPNNPIPFGAPNTIDQYGDLNY